MKATSRRHVSWIALVVVCTAAVASNRSRAEGLHQLPGPTLFKSPSGTCVLSVDGGDDAAGGAEYVLTRDGVELWSGSRAFSLWKAVVSDDGCVGGVDLRGGDFVSGRAFEILVLAPDGRILSTETIRRQWTIWIDSRRTEPGVRGVFLQQTLDEFVVRLDFGSRGDHESWWRYRLSTGESLRADWPSTAFPNPEDWLGAVDAREVRGTPLTLVQWMSSDGRGRLFTVLVDPALEPVWSLDPQDELSRDASGRFLAESTILRSDEPGRFELRRARSTERVTYRVERDASSPSGWRVDEVARRVAGGLGPIPRLELRRITTVDLGLRNETPRLPPPFSIAIDRTARIVVCESRTGLTRTFDTEGRLLASWWLTTVEGLGRAPSVEDIALEDAGDIYVRLGQFFGFDATGEPIGFTPLGGEHVVFGARSFDHWSCGAEGDPAVIRISADANLLARIEQLPDGRWLDGSARIAVDEDGTLALLQGTTLALYTPAGAPLQSIEIPSGAEGRRLSFSNGRVLISPFLVRPSDGSVSALNLLGKGTSTQSSAFLSPDGRELWCVEHEPLRLHRYALPD